MSGRSAESAELWAQVAAAWERHRDLIAAMGAPVATRLVELLDPLAGETILEVACGNGDVGLVVAPHLGDGTLIQSDVVTPMLESARRETERRQLGNVTHVELDAERLDLADATVDGVVCRWGYMLLSEPVRALRETARVLRPEGRVAFAVWAESARNPWATTIGRSLVELGLAEPPDPDAPGPFSLGDRELLLQTVRRAGLDAAHEEEVAVEHRTPSVDAFWSTSLDLSTTLRDWVAPLTAEQVAVVRERVEEALAPYRDGEAVRIPGVSHVVLARPA